MGLEDDRGRLDELTVSDVRHSTDHTRLRFSCGASKAYTREAAAEHFDMRPSTYKDQSPAVLKTVKEQVSSSEFIPMMLTY